MGYGNEAGFASTHRTITVGGTMAFAEGGYADQRWTCAAAPARPPAPAGCDAAWGPGNPGSNYGPCVSIWAPAWNIRVAHSAHANSYREPGGASSGTSFAAPYVAGVIARLFELNPTLTSTQVWNELTSRADQRHIPPNQTMSDFDPSGVVNRRLVYMPSTE